MAELAFPWDLEAMKDLPMPEGLAPVEQMGFQALRQVYRSYYSKVLTVEAAAREKRLIVLAVHDAQATEAFQNQLAQHHAQILRDTEAAKTACRKDPTPENALRLCDVLDGLLRRENT